MNAPVPASAFRTPIVPVGPGFAALKHLPGPPWRETIPVLSTIRFLRDPLAAVTRNAARFGPIYRHNAFGGWNVSLLGPDANELVFFDRDRNFSSEGGWSWPLGRLFPRGLMLMDFDEHRVHRRTLSVAFKPEPMRNYLGALNAGIGRRVAEWGQAPSFAFYPAIKQLTLDLAATSFLGIDWGPEAARINRAFVDMVAASIAVIRRPLPGTAMKRGVDGRRFMCEFFGREIPKRRGAAGDDIFTQICNATHDGGQPLSDQDVIDHMNFLMMAAHDTLTSSLSSTVWYLGANPEWQERLRAEMAPLRAGGLTYEALAELPLTEMVFKEAMRLRPPVPSVPRQALRDFEFQGHRVPAGAFVGLSPMYTHRMPDVWPDPERFDPERFTPDAVRVRHKYAWVPFGGGGHMCLGLHFAYMQAKAFLFALLADHVITVEPGYEPKFAMFPIPKPVDGLPIRLERR